QVHLTIHERFARRLRRVVRLDGAEPKESFEIGLMGRSLRDCDCLAVEVLGIDLELLCIPANREPSRCVEVTLREIDRLEQARRNLVTSNHSICITAHECWDQLIPGADLYIAGCPSLQANRTGEINVEACENALFVIIVEGRKIAVGQEA